MMKRLLYLYREIMPYNIQVLKILTNNEFEIKVIHKVRNKKSPFNPPNLKNIEFIDENEFDIKYLKKYALKYNPDLTFICDWSIKKYNRCGAFLRKKLGIPVIVGCDTQWRAGKQWLNVLTSKFRHHRYFSHILVAGVRQFEYAKRLGFKNEHILMNLYSANLEIFNKIEINQGRFEKERNFLFVGRFVEAKGIKYLLEAWNSIENKKGSKLIMIGEGNLKKDLNFPDDVNVHPFMDQKELLKFAKTSSCFILPSVFEPWALVIQEFAAAGLPLIVTNSCGAAPQFVINGYNGYVVSPCSVSELRGAIEKIININLQDLYTFGKRSRQLSGNINSEMVAYSLTSVLQ